VHSELKPFLYAVLCLHSSFSLIQGQIFCGNPDRRRLGFAKETFKTGLRVNGFSIVHLTWIKGKTKVNISSSSYGVKRGRLRVWSGCEVGVSIAPVFSHSVLGGSVLASVWVCAISPYRVSPPRPSSSSGACSAHTSLGLPVRGEGAAPGAGVVRPPQLDRGCHTPPPSAASRGPPWIDLGRRLSGTVRLRWRVRVRTWKW
jgi:hypothetical protein